MDIDDGVFVSYR